MQAAASATFRRPVDSDLEINLIPRALLQPAAFYRG
jgi:hypothetical protein